MRCEVDSVVVKTKSRSRCWKKSFDRQLLQHELIHNDGQLEFPGQSHNMAHYFSIVVIS